MEKSPIVEVAKKTCPAVITIVISKDLPKVEGFYFFPFAPGQKFIFPKLKNLSEKLERTLNFSTNPFSFLSIRLLILWQK